MVFSSSPVYLQDQYPNWHQQTYHQQGISHVVKDSQLQQSVLPPQQGISHVVKDSQLQQSVLPPPPKAGGGGGLMTKPSSMTDRARLARLPQPEAGLNCPRCDSTNTKFCYFNNYNLSQPRHFCKSCRRYWTRGGSLRNVPVGGGCRKNKRSKNNSRSNSQVKTGKQRGPKSTSSSPSSNISGHLPQPSIPPLFPFMADGLQCSSGFQTQVAVATGGVLGGGQPDDLGFHMGVDQWRLPNFFSGLETPAISGFTGQLNYPLKMEEKQGFQMGNLGNSNQYWGGNSWADFSSINSSSATHLL